MTREAEVAEMAEHTPGPWELGKPVPAPFQQTIYDGMYFPLFQRQVNSYPAIFDLCDYSLSRPPEESAANARLIAAAPELLAALELYLTQHKGGTPSNSPCRCFICDSARVAIAKAKGGG